jgi:ABC-type glycerol-3-phosphate transport system substrate-binding protein
MGSPMFASSRARRGGLGPFGVFARSSFVALGLSALLGLGCGRARSEHDKVHLVYWEKWSGAEATAMQTTVDAFNASQDRIFVEFLSVSGVDRKTILATAGGAPPDVAGVWVQNLASWADLDALTPLDELMRLDGTSPDEFMSRYEAGYASAAQYDGHVYALYATPASMALHWNKKAFREAGLDPERPPATIAELEEFSRRLTKRDPSTGELTQVGFLPQDPGWWPWSFPRYFGGDLITPDGRIVYDALPENLASMRWVRILVGSARRSSPSFRGRRRWCSRAYGSTTISANTRQTSTTGSPRGPGSSRARPPSPSSRATCWSFHAAASTRRRPGSS